jgi:glycosyltransferase involved in cell wall biosynthesis
MKGAMPMRLLLALAIASIGNLAAAQELYRWTDEKGRTQITDIAPPPGAKDVRKIKPAANTAAPSTPGKPGAQLPFVLARAMKEYPITLYTSPNCTEPCNAARDLLNKRGVPFSEVQVWEEESNAELKRVSGNNQVPALKVGSTVQSGYAILPYATDRNLFATYLSSADVYVHPKYWETFGLTCAESLACGTPVVAHNLEALPEVIDHKKTGYLVDTEGDSTEFIKGVQYILGLPSAQYDYMCASAVDKVAKNFTEERMYTEYMNLYKKLLNKQ